MTVAAACYAAACYAVACASLAPALVAPTLLIGIPLYFLGTGAITVDNPPLDASRLDVIPSRLWCRAEGVRTLGRHTATALAPLAFGMSSSSSAPGAGSASLAPAADRAEVTCRAPSS